MWAKFDCNGASAYASKTLSPPSDWWFEADVWVPSTTLTACSDGDLFGFSAFIVALMAGGSFVDTIATADVNYPHGAWEWQTGGTDTPISVTTGATHTIKAHISGFTISWYVDGSLLVTHSLSNTTDHVNIGGFLSDTCSCEWYFVSNVKVGTTDGATDIFVDDFSSGDFSNWTSTTGACSVVAAPSTCGGGAPTISAAPGTGCHGDTVTVTGSGFAATSPLTVTFGGIPVVFSEATSDGSGNVSGTLVVPNGLAACNTCHYAIVVTDGSADTATFSFTLCCPRSADSIDAAVQFGPTLVPNFGDFTGLDYIHHAGAHWVVVANEPASPSAFTTFPPDLTFRPLTVYRVPDDGSSVTSFDIDTDFCWQFGTTSGHAGEGLVSCPPGGSTTLWVNGFYFTSWSKPILDARFGSDGTNLTLAVLTEATVPYPYLSSDDCCNCNCLADGLDSQADQFISLSALTSGFTSFWTGTGGAAPFGYDRKTKLAIGALDFYHDAVPVSDGGDSWSGHWTIPRLRVFALSGSATDIGHLDALYYPGGTAGQDVAAVAPFGSPPLQNIGQLSNLLSGVSVSASAAEVGVCHVVFAEGGAWGRYGASGAHGPFSTWAVWDGNAPNIDYRINHSRWSPGGMIDQADIFHNHLDRSTMSFPYDSGSGTAHPTGYTWPATADLAWSDVYQVRNNNGSPVLFLADAQTIPDTSPPNGDPDPHGNPWLDNMPWYAEGTLRAYSLPGPTLAQTLDPSLLPTTADGVAADMTLLNVTFDVGFNPLAGLAVSDLYTDPLLASEAVYLPAVDWVAASGIRTASAFYRIPADLSATFDFLDGIRANGYSIISSFDPSNGVRRLVSDPHNLWSDAGSGPWQLDRQCSQGWASYLGLLTIDSIDATTLDFYWDGSDLLYTYGFFPGVPGTRALVKLRICRGCVPCTCGSSGLHAWFRL